VVGLEYEATKFHQAQEESRALLAEKSKEALKLSNKTAELQVEVEKLKEELAKKNESCFERMKIRQGKGKPLLMMLLTPS